jgi:hypothetical protein
MLWSWRSRSHRYSCTVTPLPKARRPSCGTRSLAPRRSVRRCSRRPRASCTAKRRSIAATPSSSWVSRPSRAVARAHLENGFANSQCRRGTGASTHPRLTCGLRTNLCLRPAGAVAAIIRHANPYSNTCAGQRRFQICRHGATAPAFQSVCSRAARRVIMRGPFVRQGWVEAPPEHDGSSTASVPDDAFSNRVLARRVSSLAPSRTRGARRARRASGRGSDTARSRGRGTCGRRWPT